MDQHHQEQYPDDYKLEYEESQPHDEQKGLGSVALGGEASAIETVPVIADSLAHDDGQPGTLETDIVKAQTIAGAINAEISPVDKFETINGFRPTREGTQQTIEAGEKRLEEGAFIDRWARSDLREKINNLSNVWKDQDVFIADRSHYYDSLYEANPDKFADTSVADFLETAKKEKALYADVDRQGFILDKIINGSLTGLDDVKERYTAIVSVDVSSLDSKSFVEYGKQVSSVTSSIQSLPRNLGGVSYHGQAVGPSFGLSRGEIEQRQSWRDYQGRYGTEVDAFIDQLRGTADAMSPIELIDEVKGFVATLAEKQESVVQQSLDTYNGLIADIKGEPWPKAA